MELVFKNFSKEQKIAMGEILGTIPSDGHFGINKSGLYNYILCVKDRDFIEYIAQDFLKLGIKVFAHRRKSGLWYIEVSRRWFDKLLNILGENIRKKIIRELCLYIKNTLTAERCLVKQVSRPKQYKIGFYWGKSLEFLKQ